MKNGTYMAYGNKWTKPSEIINYKIKINCCKGRFAIIGIASSDKILDKNVFYQYNLIPLNHYYGFKTNKNIFYNGKRSHRTYGQNYSTDDIIEMCVDLENYQLSYKINNKYLGIAFKKLFKTKYKLAIYLRYVDDEITIIELN